MRIYIGHFLDGLQALSLDHPIPIGNHGWIGEANGPEEAAHEIFRSTKANQGGVLQISVLMNTIVPIGIYFREEVETGKGEEKLRSHP